MISIPHTFVEEILIPSPELRHRCRASSIPSAYGTRVITYTNGRLRRCGKLRTHHCGSPTRVPPIAARIRRTVITTSALCRKHQPGRSPRGTPTTKSLLTCRRSMTHMTPNETSRLFSTYIILDVVSFPSCICQRGSGPFFG